MPPGASAGLRTEDVVAVALPPGPEWIRIVAEVWDAGAALFPVDHRLPQPEVRALLDRAAPTVVHDAGAGWARLPAGVPADPKVALVVHTSGTGGALKLAQFDRAAIDAAVASSALALEATPHDRWLCCLPLAHVGGLLVLLRAVLLGAPVTVHASFEPVAVGAERDAGFVSIVPAMLLRLLDANADLSHLRAILVGGSALSAGLRARAEAADARVIETYGLTESCGGVVYDGRPLAGIEARIDPRDQGIQLRGPTLMLGYRFDGEGTAAAFTEDGWLRTFDAGLLDPEGKLRVLGRLDDLIKTGGERVWPDEVEHALRTHAKVADASVAGRLDPEWGQRVVAYVVSADPASPPTLEELRDHVSITLPRHKAPRELVLVHELPRTASGKVRRAGLGLV